MSRSVELKKIFSSVEGLYKDIIVCENKIINELKQYKNSQNKIKVLVDTNAHIENYEHLYKELSLNNVILSDALSKADKIIPKHIGLSSEDFELNIMLPIGLDVIKKVDKYLKDSKISNFKKALDSISSNYKPQDLPVKRFKDDYDEDTFDVKRGKLDD